MKPSSQDYHCFFHRGGGGESLLCFFVLAIGPSCDQAAVYQLGQFFLVSFLFVCLVRGRGSKIKAGAARKGGWVRAHGSKSVCQGYFSKSVFATVPHHLCLSHTCEHSGSWLRLFFSVIIFLFVVPS